MTKHIAPLLLALLPGVAAANINIVFDYSYDTGFFADATRKNLLEAAASVYETRITDSLGAITSTVPDNEFDIDFYDPRDTNNYLNFNHDVPALNYVSLTANEYRIYVGGSTMDAGTLGVGGPGSFAYATTVDENNNFDANGQAFYDSISRGQTGFTPADDLPGNDTDFAPWGGSISFNNNFNDWYFDPNPATTESFSGYDFYSVALHEIAHVLGFGTADSWFNLVNVPTHTFNGAASGAVALENDDSHWKDDVTFSPIDDAGSFEAALDPSIPPGTRKNLTDLDWNGLRDVGWQVAVVPEPETWAMLLAGLGLVVMMARRRA